jgi:8-oxo-dGTP pyrophosphatase MutT (NUDIX family)
VVLRDVLWFNARMPRKPRARAPQRRSDTRFEISAGGVIYRRTGRGIEFALIATKSGTRWQLPKGKQEKGETLEMTAAREVAEETGLVGTVQGRLEAIDIWFNVTEGGQSVRHHKIVHFFLLGYDHGTTDDHDDEVDDARWFPAADALVRLTFPSERRVTERALEVLRAEHGGDGKRSAAER